MKFNWFQFLVFLFNCFKLFRLTTFTKLYNWKHAAGLGAGCHNKPEHRKQEPEKY